LALGGRGGHLGIASSSAAGRKLCGFPFLRLFLCDLNTPVLHEWLLVEDKRC
jgi:hypothetical protein